MTEDNDFDKNNESLIEGFRIKFVLIGDKKVGKTSIVNLYMNHKKLEEYKPTIGIEVSKTTLLKNTKEKNIY